MTVSPILIWFLLGIFFFVTELIAPGFVLFFLGIGAWCVASVLTVVDISLTTQMIIFLICSLATLILLRSRLSSIFSGDSSEKEDAENAKSASSTGVVTEAIIPPASGRVQYGGSFWRAIAEEPIPKDTVVKIIKRKDLVLQVHTLDSKEIK
ncbi:MAG: NfeD family protein [Candidatus Electrothrix sp. AR4]|nr:NfeD family protein [Candidatus Electrothrix sp. AR4]